MTQMTVQTEPGATPEASQGAAAPRAPRRHVGALDGLRAIAVAAVVAYHLDPTWLPGGYLGVDVFFVLSGYLITSGLVRDHDDRDGIRLGRFWLRRLRRLVPALWTMTLVITAALSLMPSDLRAGLGRQLLGAFTWTSNWLSIMADDSYFAEGTPIVFVHLWSLAIEEQFYLLWPLAVLSLSRPRLVRLCWSIVALAPLLRLAALLVHADPMFVYRGTLFRIDALVWGALIALGTNWRSLPWLGAALTLPLVVWCRGFAFGAAPMQIAGYSGIALFFAGAVGWAAARSPRWLELRGLRLAGRYSYGAYLLHWPLVAVNWDHFHQHPVGLLEQFGWVALQALAVLALAALSYELVEKRFLKLRSRAAIDPVRAGVGELKWRAAAAPEGQEPPAAATHATLRR